MENLNKYIQILQAIAEKEGKSIGEVIDYVDRAIESAYKKSNPVFIKLFGYKKPNIEEFLDIIVMEVKKIDMTEN